MKDSTCTHDRFGNYEQAIKNISYQTQFLQKIFPSYGLLSVIEYLDLEKLPLATISFVFLLQLSFRHNESILKKIEKPILSINTNTLNLSYNCVKHLNIISDSTTKDDCLLFMLNKAQTAMGKRLFREWFLNPLTNPEEINDRYSITGDMIHAQKYKLIQSHLENIYDLERLARRISLSLLNPCEFSQIHVSVTNAQSIIDLLRMNGLERTIQEELDLSELNNYIENHIDLQEVQKYNLDNIYKSFFCKGVYQDIDELETDLTQETSYIDDICKALNTQVKSEMFKVEHNQIDKYHLTITTKRYNDFKHSLQTFNFKNFNFKDTTVKTLPTKTSIKIHHDSFKKVNENIEVLQDSLSKLVKEKYMILLQDVCSRFNSLLNKIAKFIAQIDFYATNAKTAFTYRYHLPTIQNRHEGKSFIFGEDMRHPIIERICTSVPYVSNNIYLGTPEVDGMLLYGTNMVGKSSYMKAIGICIIMAQAGMYVPCRNFTYFPYKDIFTRIPSGDDLYKGQSTFAVEIMELRNILRRANSASLVIGDELASGTESISAVAIVGAGIVQLAAARVSFVFATHLHDLTKLNCINKLVEDDSLKVFHLSVEYDEINKKLIYDRKLKEGQGETLYGLEVCRALDLPDSFIRMSNEFRQELLKINPNIVSTKSSKYNLSHFVDKCDVCSDDGVEVHHIHQQALADKNGYINDMHKNIKYNLMNVCEKCHDKIHRNEIFVNGYIQTSNGIELQIKRKEDSINLNVAELKSQGFSKHKIKSILEERGMSITMYKLNKMLQDANNTLQKEY